MKDTTDEDQHPDQAAEGPRPDPATVSDEVDDVQDLILTAGEEETPPPAPALLDEADDTESLEDAESSSTEPSNAESSRAEPTRAEPTRDAEPSGGVESTADIGSTVDAAASADAEAGHSEVTEHAGASDDAGPGEDAELVGHSASTDEGAWDEEPASTDDPPADDQTDEDGSVVDDEPEVIAEPTYEWFDCTGDDEQGALDAAEAARDAVEDGELVVLPTDTVYGIGADAFNADAVQRLLDAKVRGRDMPPPVLIADANLMQGLVADVPDGLLALVALHWPGALTVICKARTTLKMDLGETEGTIALRVPDHDLTRELLRQTGPLAVSSANLSGLPAALTCEEALDQLGGTIAVYLDGGPLGGITGASSTIVDFSQDDNGEVLRHGAVSLEILRETLPGLIDLVEPEDDDGSAEPAGSDEPVDPTEPVDPPEPVDPIETAADSTDDAVSGTGPPEPDTPAAGTVPEDFAEPTRTQQDLDAVASVDWDALNDTDRSEDDALTYGEADEDERHDGLADDGSALAHPADGSEPTTDDLRITHGDTHPEQPGLFEGEDEGRAQEPSTTGAQTLQPPTGP